MKNCRHNRKKRITCNAFLNFTHINFVIVSLVKLRLVDKTVLGILFELQFAFLDILMTNTSFVLSKCVYWELSFIQSM